MLMYYRVPIIVMVLLRNIKVLQRKCYEATYFKPVPLQQHIGALEIPNNAQQRKNNTKRGKREERGRAVPMENARGVVVQVRHARGDLAVQLLSMNASGRNACKWQECKCQDCNWQE
jgi:hypothetical protein